MIMAQTAVIGLLLVSAPALACDACQTGPDPYDQALSNGVEAAESIVENGTIFHNGRATDTILRAAEQVMNATGEVREAKNDTAWTASEILLEVYDEAMKSYPRSVPQFEVRGVTIGGKPVPTPLVGPENYLQTRSQPTKDETPNIDDEVRKTRDDLLPDASGEGEAQEDPSAVPKARQDNSTEAHAERVAAQGAPGEPTAGPTAPASTPPVGKEPQTDPHLEPKGGTASLAEPPWNTGAAIMGGLAGVAFLTWLLSRGGFLARLAGGLPVVRLFSRQTGREILKHPGRRQIYDAIANQPGITGPQLSQVTCLAASTVRYHLKVLRRERVVHIARDGKIMHYHVQPVGGDALAKARNCLFRRRRALLARAILARPGTSQQAIAKRTGLPPSRVCSYVRDLARHGLVEVEKTGRFRNYFASSNLTTLHEQGHIPEQ